MEIIKIVRRERNLLEILMIIWEDSVRHTHDFLRENDIKALRPLVYQNLESIPELWAIKAEDSCYKGFMVHLPAAQFLPVQKRICCRPAASYSVKTVIQQHQFPWLRQKRQTPLPGPAFL